MIIEFCLFIILIFLIFKLIINPSRKYPPGPWNIPFVTSNIVMNENQAKKMREKYGDIFMVKFGAAKFLYLADYQMTKELMSKIEASARPDWKSVHTANLDGTMTQTALGVLFSSGDHWTFSRRFFLRNLRDFGMGKSKMEDVILTETQALVDEFKTLTEEPSNLPSCMNIAVLNIIWHLVAGQRHDIHDDKMETLVRRTQTVVNKHNIANIDFYFPILKYLLPASLMNKMGVDMLMKFNKEFNESFLLYIKEHEATLDPENPRDIMDNYLIEQKNPNGGAKYFSEVDHLRALRDLFVAGNDTTSNMLRWIILYMAAYPDIQQKVQEEIDNVVSRDTLPKLEHRSRLTYVDAMINEALRIVSFVKFSVFHSISEDIEFRGYYIPKNTVVHPLNCLIQMDPRYWKNPEEFNPSRFLDDDGKLLKFSDIDGYLPFGVGRRQCLGESLARMELYLIATGLLQNFTFAPDTGKKIDLTPAEVPLLRYSKPQNLIIKIRK